MAVLGYELTLEELLEETKKMAKYEITYWGNNAGNLRIVLRSNGHDVALDYDERGDFAGGFARPFTADEKELVSGARKYIEQHAAKDDWYTIKLGDAVEALMGRRESADDE